MSRPLISINSLRNYASKLTVGTITERASVQAILDRINYHLTSGYPGSDLTLVITPLEIDHANVSNPNQSIFRNIANNDEIYHLTDSKSPNGYHLFIYEDFSNPIRSIVLGLTPILGQELFGKITEATTYTLTTEGYCKSSVENISELTGELIITPDMILAQINANFNHQIVGNPNGEWSLCNGVTYQNEQYCLNTVVIQPEDYAQHGITADEPLTQIDLSWVKGSGVVKTFTIGDEWHILTGAARRGDGAWLLTHRPATQDEIPESVSVTLNVTDEDSTVTTTQENPQTTNKATTVTHRKSGNR